MSNRVKVHPEHKKRMKQMFLVGFTPEEIAIAYKCSEDIIRNITQGLTQVERI